MQKSVGAGPVGNGGIEGWGSSRGRGLVSSKVGVGGNVGYGGCEPRIEGIVHKRIVQY